MLTTGGGGIAAGWCAKLVFCEISRNSIYNNNATKGHDILFVHCSGGDIYLDMGSRKMTTIDYQYIDLIFHIIHGIHLEELLTYYEKHCPHS